MLVLPNVTIELSNVRKNKCTTECNKSTIICDVGTTKFDNGTIKYEEKKKEPLNVTKVWPHVMLMLPNVTIELSNMRKQ